MNYKNLINSIGAILCLVLVPYGCSKKSSVNGGQEMIEEAGHEGHGEEGVPFGEQVAVEHDLLVFRPFRAV